MKNLGKIMFAFAFMFAPMIVNAQEIENENGLIECLASASESVCTLTSDIETTGWVMPTGTKTLDLNGHRISMNTGSFWIAAGQNLTVTGNGTVITNTATYATFGVYKNGSLTLESGEFKNATGNVVDITGNNTENDVYVKLGKDAKLTGSYGIVIRGDDNNGNAANNVKVDVYGNIIASAFAISTNGLITSANTENVPTVNVFDGAEIKSTAAAAIYGAGTAKWTVSGGKITGTEALSIKAGSYTISGGTFVANGEKDDNPAPYNNGSEPTGAALSVTANSAYDRNVSINITGGKFISENGYALYEGKTSASNTAIVKISIAGGEFVSEEASNDAIKITSVSETLENFITGGTFSSEVDEKYRAEGYENVEIDGVVIVAKPNTITVITNENGAIEVNKSEAKIGDAVKVTAKANNGYELKTIIVKDASGNIIAVNDGEFVMPNSAVTVSAEFTKKVEVSTPENPEKDPVVIPEEPKDEENPKTGDTILSSITVGLISLIGLGISVKSKKFN